VLNQEGLQNLLTAVNDNFPLSTEREFTVEAGRPETLDRRKAMLLKELNVNRVSVNPQTMKEQTLRLIGRRHTTAQVLEAVSLVREAGISLLNMDLIMGLPGEDLQDWEYTLAKIKELAPENLTLHTLAPKRAAAWNFQEVRAKTSEDILAEWLGQNTPKLKASGYHPYYLYRQRRILANQENIGYCKAGAESVILMMEERRTILGLGGGAMTKWVDPGTLKVNRTPNPKCPATYRGRIKELVEEKVSYLRRTVN
jgi:oxygen-independent coproporphyrinogen-3 oxidase